MLALCVGRRHHTGESAARSTRPRLPLQPRCSRRENSPCVSPSDHIAQCGAPLAAPGARSARGPATGDPAWRRSRPAGVLRSRAPGQPHARRERAGHRQVQRTGAGTRPGTSRSRPLIDLFAAQRQLGAGRSAGGRARGGRARLRLESHRGHRTVGARRGVAGATRVPGIELEFERRRRQQPAGVHPQRLTRHRLPQQLQLAARLVERVVLPRPRARPASTPNRCPACTNGCGRPVGNRSLAQHEQHRGAAGIGGHERSPRGPTPAPAAPTSAASAAAQVPAGLPGTGRSPASALRAASCPACGRPRRRPWWRRSGRGRRRVCYRPRAAVERLRRTSHPAASGFGDQQRAVARECERPRRARPARLASGRPVSSNTHSRLPASVGHRQPARSSTATGSALGPATLASSHAHHAPAGDRVARRRLTRSVVMSLPRARGGEASPARGTTRAACRNRRSCADSGLRNRTPARDRERRSAR